MMSGSSVVLIDEKAKDDLFNLLDNGSRQEISEAVMNPEVRLGDLDRNSGNSLLYDLLTKVTNGDKIVLQKLDKSVGATNNAVDPDSEDFNILIDQKVLVNDDPRNLTLLSDLLSLPRGFTHRILNHPVLTTFIKRRWPRLLFFVMAFIYFLFVVNYSFFLVLLFSSSSSLGFLGFDCKTSKSEECKDHNATVCKRTCYRNTPFKDSYGNDDKTMLAAEICLITSGLVLLMQEIWQCLALRKDYARELENWFEVGIISFSLFTFFDYSETRQSIVGAVAVGCAWIELVLMCGRIPFEGGTFNIMFYASSKRVLQIAIGLVLMVIAFAAAFFVLHYDQGVDSPFSTIPMSIVNSFSWMLDGADVDAIYDASSEAEQSTTWVEVVAICLVAFMMIFGSLILINLIVATIIMDFGWIRELALETSLRNQAHTVVQARTGKEFLKRFYNICVPSKDMCEEEKEAKFRELEVMVCVHSVCRCGSDKETLDKETTMKLKKILNIDDEEEY